MTLLGAKKLNTTPLMVIVITIPLYDNSGQQVNDATFETSCYFIDGDWHAMFPRQDLRTTTSSLFLRVPIKVTNVLFIKTQAMSFRTSECSSPDGKCRKMMVVTCPCTLLTGGR
jgi:hypothetical protein